MKKLWMCFALFSALALGLFVCACSDESGRKDPDSDGEHSTQPNKPDSNQPDPNKPTDRTDSFEVSLDNDTSWTPSGNIQLWSLDGELVEQRAISDNEAQFQAGAGRYIIQLDSAPETVAYELPVTDGEEKAVIRLTEAEEDEEYGYAYGCTAVVLKAGDYYEGCFVGNCIMPDDGSLGACFNPVEVEDNCAHLYAFTGKFHISVYDDELIVIKEFEDVVSTNKRFVILNLDGESAEHVHSYIWETVKEATCTEAGSRTGTCACGETTTEEVPALGHTSGEYTVIKEPTCSEPGVGAASVCERCGEATDEVAIPALGHDWVEGGSYKPATCTQPGYSASAKCSRCDEVRADEVIPALGHDFSGNTFVHTEATCQQTGRANVYCSHSGCNESQFQTIPKRDHEFTAVRTIVAPTCTEGGRIKKVCRFYCGQELEPEDVPPLGHDWKEISIEKVETCTEKGNRTHYCERCKITEKYESDAHGHVYGDYVVTKEATNSKEGEKARECVFCKELDSDKVKVPKITDEVEYEIIVRRTNGKFYYDVSNLKFDIYKGDTKLNTVDAAGNSTKVKLSRDATSLKVTGLNEGYSSKQESYELKAGKPVVNIEIDASIITSNHATTADGKPVETPPQNDYMKTGSVMYDFLVRDTRGEAKWLSDLMKGKKLILIDLWWTGCTICHYEMGQFLLAYDKVLQPYKEDILVIMINVMQDEDSRRIEEFRAQKGYPDEFIMSTGWDESGNVSIRREWFTDIGTPGNIWIDDQGVVISRKRCERSERFQEFTLNYFRNYTADEVDPEVKTFGAEDNVQGFRQVKFFIPKKYTWLF